METRYANIFIDAWNTVLESFSSKQIMSADIKPPKEYPDKQDIFVFVGMAGDINGQIYMSMDGETGKILASEMLGGMEITGVDELVMSAVGELCNMIMGSACSAISSTNKSVDITPPTVISDQQLPQLKMEPSYNIAFLLEDLEVIDFNVAVKTA